MTLTEYIWFRSTLATILVDLIVAGFGLSLAFSAEGVLAVAAAVHLGAVFVTAQVASAVARAQIRDGGDR